ncbi:MAG TPA: thioredoxin-dependent thiol peroxidase [Gemmatimonadales bacterium]|nr:thioredoxin-dependent thiol peroxidase [Gemmatimonadales bacterium]
MTPARGRGAAGTPPSSAPTPPPEGAAAPPFTLASDQGPVRLADFRGRPVVLYFYPRDDTTGCTKEACDFRDHWSEIGRAGAVVLGVSPDGVDSHVRFKRKHALPFPLLADPDHAVAERYGVWGEKSMYGRKYLGIIRTTFLIDGGGRIAKVWSKVRVPNHADEVLEALGKLEASG